MHTQKTPPAIAGLALAALFALAACSNTQLAAVQTDVTTFEAKAAPVVANGCATFHAAEVNPLVQIGLGLGNSAASAATGGVAGPVLASLKSFGDQFCALGPPPATAATPATTDAQQASWLAGVTSQLLGAAGVK